MNVGDTRWYQGMPVEVTELLPAGKVVAAWPSRKPGQRDTFVHLAGDLKPEPPGLVPLRTTGPNDEAYATERARIISLVETMENPHTHGGKWHPAAEAFREELLKRLREETT